jgi:hypothetical protein
MPILGIQASSRRSVPAAPTIGAATDIGTARAYNNGAASITFTAPFDGKLPITSYTVTSSPGGFTASGASSPLTVTGLASSTAYTFTVTATNAIGTSTASAATASITATTVPQAPTIGTATAGNALATVGYTAGATGGKAISVYTATSSGGQTGTGASPITVSGLANGTAYTFTVRATNANGQSLASGTSNSVTPVVPYALGGVGQGGGIIFYDAGSTLSWGRYIEAAVGTTSPAWTESAYSIGGSEYFFAPSAAIGAGLSNTNALVATNGTAGRAQVVMRAYRGGGFSNWHLSSRDELNQMFIRRGTIGGISYQWSSSTDFGGGSQFIFAHSFSDGTVQSFNVGNTLRARPVRYF